MPERMSVKEIANLATMIRAARLAQGLTRDELARATGLSPKFISHVEGAKPTAQIGKVLLLLTELGIQLYAEPAASIPDFAIAKATQRRRIRHGS
jgi:transcriptional regulator with XRE-family HTH domain